MNPMRLPELAIGIGTFIAVRLVPQPEGWWASLACAIIAGVIFWSGIEWYAARRSRRIFSERRPRA